MLPLLLLLVVEVVVVVVMVMMIAIAMMMIFAAACCASSSATAPSTATDRALALAPPAPCCVAHVTFDMCYTLRLHLRRLPHAAHFART